MANRTAASGTHPYAVLTPALPFGDVADQAQAECRRGWHGPTVDGVPQDGGTYVNVDAFCSRCGVLVVTTSWRADAWHKHVAKSTRRRRSSSLKV